MIDNVSVLQLHAECKNTVSRAKKKTSAKTTACTVHCKDEDNLNSCSQVTRADNYKSGV